MKNPRISLKHKKYRRVHAYYIGDEWKRQIRKRQRYLTSSIWFSIYPTKKTLCKFTNNKKYILKTQKHFYTLDPTNIYALCFYSTKDRFEVYSCELFFFCHTNIVIQVNGKSHNLKHNILDIKYNLNASTANHSLMSFTPDAWLSALLNTVFH